MSGIQTTRPYSRVGDRARQRNERGKRGTPARDTPSTCPIWMRRVPDLAAETETAHLSSWMRYHRCAYMSLSILR